MANNPPLDQDSYRWSNRHDPIFNPGVRKDHTPFSAIDRVLVFFLVASIVLMGATSVKAAFCDGLNDGRRGQSEHSIGESTGSILYGNKAARLHAIFIQPEMVFRMWRRDRPSPPKSNAFRSSLYNMSVKI